MKIPRKTNLMNTSSTHEFLGTNDENKINTKQKLNVRCQHILNKLRIVIKKWKNKKHLHRTNEARFLCVCPTLNLNDCSVRFREAPIVFYFSLI